ncbi:MAG: glycosyltransferase family 2 protein [Elusimicrobiota bacterium]|nr:glycosyltransferase family 2 protein [Endomicrobiia bacterium]MDW7998804.1 glycosyltransferase family 2 protein [Thermodesulfovibrio sp.]MDW8165901.1 glycosyltransferase family 2 protein [Elusimicrobiota bacterium]
MKSAIYYEVPLLSSKIKPGFWHLKGEIQFKTPPCDLLLEVYYNDQSTIQIPIPFTLRGKLDYIIKLEKTPYKIYLITNHNISIKTCTLRGVNYAYALYKFYRRILPVLFYNNEANRDLKIRIDMSPFSYLMKPYRAYKKISLERTKRICQPFDSNVWLKLHQNFIKTLFKKIKISQIFVNKPVFTIIYFNENNHKSFIDFSAVRQNYKKYHIISIRNFQDLYQLNLQSDYVLFLYNGDKLDPHALEILAYFIKKHKYPELVYFDSASENIDEKLEKRKFQIFLKPDLSIDYLKHYNYIKNAFLVRRDTFIDILQRLSRSNSLLKLDFIHIFLLKLVQDISKYKIYHLPLVLLYHNSKRLERNSQVIVQPKHLQFKKTVFFEPLVSIIIPTKDKVSLLSKCLHTIFTKTTYKNYEIILIDNNSSKDETFRFYTSLEKMSLVKIVFDKGDFNFSRLINTGVKKAKGDYLCFLNNDIEVETPQWIEEMLYFTVKPKVGVVGAKLIYPNGTVQHGGVIVGIWELADHAFKGCTEKEDYMNRLITPQEYLAVTAACMMTKRKIFEEVGGFDEILKFNFQDLDFCLKVYEKGYKIIYTPYAVSIHHEHSSRGKPDNKEKLKILEKEKTIIKNRWQKYIQKDPFYNPNLSIFSTKFQLNFSVTRLKKALE